MRLAQSFFGWFMKFSGVSLGAILSGTELRQTMLSKPFYMPMEVLGALGAFFILLYVSIVVLDSFYPVRYEKSWVLIYAFCTIIGAGFNGNEQIESVVAMCLTLAIINTTRFIIINQFAPDENGNPKIINFFTAITNKFSPKVQA